jgi:hypothetical protein
MYDTTVQGVLQVHVTCVIIPIMDRLVSGSKLVTFPFKLFPNFPQNFICYYCYFFFFFFIIIIIFFFFFFFFVFFFFFLHFVVYIFVIHCVPQTTIKATVILVNWMYIWYSHMNNVSEGQNLSNSSWGVMWQQRNLFCLFIAKTKDLQKILNWIIPVWL